MADALVSFQVLEQGARLNMEQLWFGQVPVRMLVLKVVTYYTTELTHVIHFLKEIIAFIFTIYFIKNNL